MTQLSPYQGMRGLGSEELNLQQKIVQTKVWVIQLKQQIDGNDQIWTKKIVQMTNSVDNTTKPLSKHDENGKKWLNEKTDSNYEIKLC